MEVNSRRTPTLVFDTLLQLAAKPESCLILVIIVAHQIRNAEYFIFWPHVHLIPMLIDLHVICKVYLRDRYFSLKEGVYAGKRVTKVKMAL